MCVRGARLSLDCVKLVFVFVVVVVLVAVAVTNVCMVVVVLVEVVVLVVVVVVLLVVLQRRLREGSVHVPTNTSTNAVEAAPSAPSPWTLMVGPNRTMPICSAASSTVVALVSPPHRRHTEKHFRRGVVFAQKVVAVSKF